MSMVVVFQWLLYVRMSVVIVCQDVSGYCMSGRQWLLYVRTSVVIVCQDVSGYCISGRQLLPFVSQDFFLSRSTMLFTHVRPFPIQ